MRAMMVGVMIGASATTPGQDLVPALPGLASNARFTAEDMQLAPGATVADIGAATGAYLDVLVDTVGPDGVVVATELSKGFRKGLLDRADAAG